jgi:sulfatase maturation enzyme AslB (radical SAM superfamily)
LSKNYNNWCVDIYRGIFIERFNDTHIRVAPCCQATAVIEPLETFEFANNHFLAVLRNKFELGEKPDECNRCWHDEQLGQNSRRINISANQLPDTTVELENLTYHSTWACNLACIMCGPHNSSTWAKELNMSSTKLEQIGKKFNKSKKSLDTVDFSKLKRIHFNGGEPLLNNDHQIVLEKLNDINALNNVNLSYNTNGTQYPTDKTIELWKKTQQVLLFFSIDATETSFEYIRYPANWQSTVDNLLRLKNTLPANVKFGFTITVGCYNIFEIRNVLDWVKQYFAGADVSLQIAYNFDPMVLNVNAKNAAIEYLKDYKELNGIVNHLISTKQVTNNRWLIDLKKIDRRRNTNWKQVLKVAEFY